MISLPTSENGCHTTEVYRKETYTGLLRNETAVCPQQWKVRLIKCIHRADTIYSSWSLFINLEKILILNGYPKDTFSSCVKNFLNEEFKPEVKCETVKEDGVETMLFIPFIGLPSMIFAWKLRQIFKTNFSTSDIKVIFTILKVKNYFSLKSQTPVPLKSGVVYKYTCLSDTNISLPST